MRYLIAFLVSSLALTTAAPCFAADDAGFLKIVTKTPKGKTEKVVPYARAKAISFFTTITISAG